MKYVRPAATIAATIALGASSAAHAGNLVQPAVESEVVMDPEIVAAGTASSAGGFVIPLLLLALIAAAASSSGSPLPEE